MQHSGTPTNGAEDRARDTRFRQELKVRLHRRLMENLDLVQAQKLGEEELRSECFRRVDVLLGDERAPLTTTEKRQLVREVLDEIFGLGPVEELMRDPGITDILVNGPGQIYIERAGRLSLTTLQFRDDDHLLQVIQRIAARVGRRIDESAPMLDARLPDGSRVNAIIPPLSLRGSTMSVRRFAAAAMEVDQLVQLDALTQEMSCFLEACVRCKMNTLISGGTGTGKTTLLNILSGWIPDNERVITIEDAAELRLQREHVVSLETRPANIEGKGEVTTRDLLRNTLRMRPDRIIIGEVRGGETLDMLQAMNTGHEGSMTTVHANSTRDALRRIENMVSMSGLKFPVEVIRDQMASTLNLIIQVARLTGGRRKVVSLTESVGIESGVILLQDVFRFVQTGIGSDGHAQGHFEPSGVRPRLLQRMQEEGVVLPVSLFQRKKAI